MYGGQWRFYQSANGEDAASLAVVVLKREAGGCSAGGCGHEEQFTTALRLVNIAAAAAGSGLSVKF